MCIRDSIYLIDVLFAIIAAMSIHEYFDSFKGKTNPVSWLGFVACGLIAFIHLIPKQYIIITIGILVPTSILILFLQVIISNMKTNVQDIAVTFFGICYIPLFLMYLPLLMGSENGKILIWFVIIAAWGTDIFAYIIGKKLGKHKFSKISPNKSIEGCIGGTLGAIIIALIYTFCINACLKIDVYKRQENNKYSKPVKVMLCSTGVETPKTGVYKITSFKQEWLGLQGNVYGQYCTQIVGNILFHSVPYIEKNNPSSLEYWEYDKLGEEARCV